MAVVRASLWRQSATKHDFGRWRTISLVSGGGQAHAPGILMQASAAMRFSYSMPRVTLLIFAVAYLALWVWDSIAPEQKQGLEVLFPVLAFLFPALLYGLSAIVLLPSQRGDVEPSREVQPTFRDTAALLTLAAVLYLSMLVALGIGGLEDRRERIRLGLSFPLSVCFIVVFLSITYSQLLSRGDWNANGKALRLERLWQRPRQWFLGVARLLRPRWFLSGGAGLVLASLFLRTTENQTGLGFLRGNEPWITSIGDVTGDIEAIQSSKAILGRATYLVALGLAAATVALLFRRKFRPQISSPSRLRTGLTGLASFLAIYSAADLNFGWLGLYAAGSTKNIHWALFCLWFTLWLLPLALWAWLSLRSQAANGTLHMDSLQGLVLLFLPAVLFDAVMAPVLVGTDLSLRGLASYVVGLQFLCWGFVRSITVKPAS